MGVWVPLPYASFAPEWIYRVPGRYGPPDHHSFLNHESVWGTAKLVKWNYLVAMAWGVSVGLCFINFIQCRSALCISHPMHSFHSSLPLHSSSPSLFHSFFLSITYCMWCGGLCSRVPSRYVKSHFLLSIPFSFILSLHPFFIHSFSLSPIACSVAASAFPVGCPADRLSHTSSLLSIPFSFILSLHPLFIHSFSLSPIACSVAASAFPVGCPEDMLSHTSWP